MSSEEFARGIEEFNRCSFFQCHDTLEDLWHGTRGSDRLFLQGLIQVSVGFYHLFNRNYKGASSQLTRGLAKLDAYRPRYKGVELELFTHEVVRWLALAEQGLKGDYPELLEREVPKIHLTQGEY